MSGISTLPTSWARPMPRRPFSAWKMTPFSGGVNSATRFGMPMPRLTNSPPLNSAATRMAMSSRGRRSFVSSIAITPHEDQAVGVDAGRRDLVRAELARLDDLLDLGDGDGGRGRHGRVEVARRVAVDEGGPPGPPRRAPRGGGWGVRGGAPG